MESKGVASLKSTNEGLRVFRLKMLVADSLTDDVNKAIVNQVTVADNTPAKTIRVLLHHTLDTILDRWEKENENS